MMNVHQKKLSFPDQALRTGVDIYIIVHSSNSQALQQLLQINAIIAYLIGIFQMVGAMKGRFQDLLEMNQESFLD